MKLGFFTACLAEPLERIAPWAAEAGFQFLEIACWPRREPGSYRSSHIDVASPAGADNARAARDLVEKHGLVVSSLGFYANHLDPDPGRRAANHEHLRRVIEAAAAMECPLVGTFIGRHPGKTIQENLAEMIGVFGPLLDFCGERGVRLMIENCPMPNWQFEGLAGNIAFSPGLWGDIFGRLPHENFGLNYDPSHLVWQDIDPVAAAREFAPRIFHAHAKDTEILRGVRDRVGNQLSHINGRAWWRYRMPGMGEVNWGRLISSLQECGYDSWLSIEHEDPVWEGSPEKVRDGLRLGLRHLATFLP